ncbi:unnamed protein product [Bursaphelenchus xylophilus]|uniref:Oligopeptide transporter 1 n=1 Tax=Bursaphelenchus xylophilus TaxID=6326 RepID=A0A1I7S047_BURXY|nr:unnamed protein product [Bursaphelenchus xylophilus]CAG9109022.1 unnamed protein product [Bursaphelenchus xylophilus]
MGKSPDDVSTSHSNSSVVRIKERPKPAETYGEMFRRWPKITFCIVGNEFCERFSFYGMRTVLTLYLLNVLKFNKEDATTFYSFFTALCYFSPIFGSLLADGFIGKFKTIFIVSIFYTAGQVLLAYSSTNDAKWGLHPWLDFLGLFIVAVGTGGIKPCVSPFGGDQFEKYELKMISLFFSVFYFSINAGSMISTFVAPIFRNTPCLGQDSCYPMAFGVPAALMVVATLIFMSGSYWYKKRPVTSNVLADVTKVVFKAIFGRFRSNVKKDHWLDYSLYNHYCTTSAECLKLKRKTKNTTACAQVNFVNDVKTLVRVVVMFLPLPVFWSLYDQQGSVWMVQSLQMDCRLWGDTLLLPDQMQTLNAVLILCFIPIFTAVIYPLAGLFFKVTPLRKMSVGGLIAAAAFVVSGFVQMEVNNSLAPIPDKGFTYVSVINAHPACTVSVKPEKFDPTTFAPYTALERQNGSDLYLIPHGEQKFTFTYEPAGCGDILPADGTFSISYKYGYLHVSENGIFYANTSYEKPTSGSGGHGISVIVATDNTGFKDGVALCRVPNDGKIDEAKPCDFKSPEDFYYYTQVVKDKETDLQGFYKYVTKSGVQATGPTVFKTKEVKPGNWRLYYLTGDPRESKENLQVKYTGYEYTKKEQGGLYVASLTGPHDTPHNMTVQYVPDNQISILWQVPQIAVITAAEILVSITGLEFSYNEAAPSMKAVVGALFLLTTATGDLLIVVITKLSPSNDMAINFFFFAALMVAVMLIFILLSIFYYEYAKFSEVTDDEQLLANDDSDEEEEEEKRSLGYKSTQPTTIGVDKLKGLDDDAWQIRL